MRVEYNESEQKIPIKLWLDDIEDGAMQQAKNLSNLPFAFKHIAIMPDSHQGYGMPIGGVIAAENTIIPNAVGKDIACGMCAIKTPWTVDEVSIDVIKKIMSRIREEVPVGFAHHKVKQNLDLMPSIGSDMSESYKGHHKCCHSIEDHYIGGCLKGIYPTKICGCDMTPDEIRNYWIMKEEDANGT